MSRLLAVNIDITLVNPNHSKADVPISDFKLKSYADIVKSNHRFLLNF